MEVYLVGGAVRDELLGLPVKERDWVVVGATLSKEERRGLSGEEIGEALRKKRLAAVGDSLEGS